MKKSEILTYSLLTCSVKQHERLLESDTGLPTNYFTVRMQYNDVHIFFMYYKDDKDENDITFIKGHTKEDSPASGFQIQKLHGFAHLMKKMDKEIE